MIDAKDSAWDPKTRELICKICGGRIPIGVQRVGTMQEMLNIFQKFEAEHVCIKIKGGQK